MLASYIEKPTLRHPILNIKKDYIRFAPVSLRYVIFTYLREPVKPIFVADYSAGYPEYDPDNSTELEWDDENIFDVIFLMVKQFGVIITIEDVKAAAAQKPKK